MPALFEQQPLGASGNRVAVNLGLGEREPEEHVVEVVAAQAVDTRRGDHFVHRPAHADERNVEGAAADVVHDDVIFFRGERAAVAVGVLEAGRRRFVEKAEHVEAGAPKRVEADETLGAVRVRRGGDEGFERFVRLEERRRREVRPRAQGAREGREELRQE